MGWIGAGAEVPAEMDAIRAHLEATFGMTVERCTLDPPPAAAFDPRRGQYASGRILAWLSERRPESARKILGVTDLDLFIPILTFVFGEAQLGGPAAVVSSARLASDGAAKRAREVIHRRLRTECVHELGHTFGLIHCERPCAMARSPGLPEVDAKKDSLCPECRLRLSELRRESEARHE